MRLERILAEFVDEMACDDDRRPRVVRALLEMLLVHVERLADVRPQREAHGLAASFEQLVRRRASATLTVGECARVLGVTPGHLSETVAAHLGRAPGEIIRSAVLHDAQRLLAQTGLTCVQVAAETGFEDASYFSRFFRRECGMTPTEFRSSTAVAA